MEVSLKDSILLCCLIFTCIPSDLSLVAVVMALINCQYRQLILKVVTRVINLQLTTTLTNPQSISINSFMVIIELFLYTSVVFS
jgi:hypothetical protein